MVKNQQCRTPNGLEFHPWVGKMPWRRPWQSTPGPGLENPMDRGARQGAESWRIRHDWATKHARTAGWGWGGLTTSDEQAVGGLYRESPAHIQQLCHPVLAGERKNAPQPGSISQPGVGPVYRHCCLPSIKKRTNWPQCQGLLFFIFRLLFIWLHGINKLFTLCIWLSCSSWA